MSLITTSRRAGNTIDNIIGLIEHYGFQVANLPNEEEVPEQENPSRTELRPFIPSIEQKDRLVPIMLYNISPEIPHAQKGKETKKKTATTTKIRLCISGIQDGLAEAILMHVSRSILNEVGAKKYATHINSMGDKESATRFNTEFIGYTRRNLRLFGPCCRNEFKSNMPKIFACRAEQCLQAKKSAPKPIDFLSENSRKHFKEVLEHLESLTIPYLIDEWLIDDRNNFLKVFFHIDSEDVPEFSISGGRYSIYPKYSKLKKESALTGACIYIASKRSIKPKKPTQEKTRKPRVFVVQLGCEARKTGLMALERLRRAKIPVIQNMDSIRLTDQICFAEENSIPYMIIIGHKEALEGAAILRNTQSRSQRVVPIDTLPSLVKQARNNGL